MEADKKPIIRARDVVEKKIVTIDGMATTQEAAALMRTEQCLYLLVEKRHENDAWGIVVIADFIKGVLVAGRSPSEVHIYEVMTKPVISVPADMDIRYVARLLHNADIRRAPVEENGEFIGVISLSALIIDNDFF